MKGQSILGKEDFVKGLIDYVKGYRDAVKNNTPINSILLFIILFPFSIRDKTDVARKPHLIRVETLIFLSF